ncbi:hypothetical protein KSS87_004989 [Heliosperma pusillum]|nr:hypothetical protein KSS87_004989 [Heliosperma pusillum]
MLISPCISLLFSGTLYKSKTDDVSNSKVKVQQSKGVLLPRIDTANGNADNKLGKNFPDKKLFKSLSFAGSATSDVPSPQFSSIIKSSGLKCGVYRGLTKNVHVPEKKSTRSLSSTRSCLLNVNSSKTHVVSEAAKTMPVLRKAAIQTDGNIDVKTSGIVAQGGKKGVPLREKLPSSPSRDAISCLKKDANSSPGCRPTHLTLKANLNNSRKDSYNHSTASEKVLQHALYPVKPMPTLAPVKNVPSSSAVPAAEYIWKGGFKLEKSAKLPNYCSGIQAHVSSSASSKIHEVGLKFGPKLEFKEVSRTETWSTYFPRNWLTEQDIAFYFFAEDMQSYRRSYKVLLDGMMGKDLVLETSFDGLQLLVLPSSLLPLSSQRWNSLFYLWGVCKARKVEDQRPRLAGLDVTKSSLDLCTSVTNRSPSKCISTVEDGSFSASQTSHNSIQGPDTVFPLVPQPSALTKSKHQSCDHGTSSIKFLGVREVDMQPDIVHSVYDLNEETSLCGALLPDDMQEGIQSENQNIKCTCEMSIFPFGQANEENMVSLAINSGENGIYSDKFHSGPDVASHSSFSIDSGPSGSSDGCARSDEKHQEHSEKPSRTKAPSLDLCLGFSSQPEEQVVDLDLMLGFPGKSQPERYPQIRNNAGDRNVSLFLSLGMSCSNA